MGIHVTVRDGRVGRDHSRDDEQGGAELMTFERDTPVDMGDRLVLPDGSTGVVIGVSEEIGPPVGWSQVVIVGDDWSRGASDDDWSDDWS